MKKNRVLIVEDDDLLRSGLASVIEAEADLAVAGMAANGLEALGMIGRSRPDIVLLDIQMPVMNGIDCIREIRKLDTQLPILILTTFNEEEYIFQGLAYGANGYLLKNIDFASLVQTIRDAMNERFVLPADVAANIARYAVRTDTYIRNKKISRYIEQQGEFTAKEQEIVKLLLNRLPNKEIARKVYVTEGTVKNYLTAIYEKLCVQNRNEAIERLEALAENQLADL